MNDLQRVIDFFTQNLHIEQIFTYGFRLFDEMVGPEKAALFVLEGDQYVAVEQTTSCIAQLPTIQKTDLHDRFAVRNGFVLGQRQVQERYFDPDLLTQLELSHILPLIAENRLVGFVFAKMDRSNVDVGFITRFTNLMNLSLEKAFRFDQQSNMIQEINQRLFNLHSMSHTMKVLLSELEVTKIYQLCIDVIREMTSSSVTSFGVRENDSNRIVLKGFQDIIRFEKQYVELELRPDHKVPDKVIYHVSKDFDLLKDLFVNAESFKDLRAEYVVLLVKDQVIGFVTIGQPVGTQKIDDRLLQQIQSIAGIMHIALVNAQRYDLIVKQNHQLDLQTKYLNRLNRALKNINSAESIDELARIALDTLHYGFGIQKAAIILTEEPYSKLIDTLGFDGEDLSGFMHNPLHAPLEDTHSSYIRSDLSPWYKEAGIEAIGDHNCHILAPVRTMGWEQKLQAILAVYQTKEPLKEEQVLLVEAMANSIAPVIKLLKALEGVDSDLILDQVQAYR